MEQNRINDSNGLAGFFEGHRKSRQFSNGYSKFIISIAQSDVLKKQSESEDDLHTDSDISDANE